MPPSPQSQHPTGLSSRLAHLRGRRPLLIAAAVILLANYLVVSSVPDPQDPTDVSFTFFKQQAELGNVLDITSRGDLIQGTFKHPASDSAQAGAGSREVMRFATVRPEFAGATLERLLESQGVIINARPVVEARSWWVNLLISFGPTLLLVAVFAWVASRMGGGLRMGRMSARRFDRDHAQRITFDDVAGVEDARAELMEVVDFLRQPERYTSLGGTVPKGVLLVGPPGTGKTLLARAVAGEANAPFFSVSASEFVEMIVGVGASRVRDLFKQARKTAPAIIFIDELDAVGRSRGAGPSNSGRSEQEQTLNQILTEMDGFSAGEGVIVLAATNRPDVLDPALLRPGRFDRQVTVQAPDRSGREAILQVHMQHVPLSPDVDVRALSSATPGLVGADLHNLVNEAVLFAARRSAEAVTHNDFMDALEKVLMGPARHVFISPVDRRRVAYHEGGHTVVGLLLAHADPVTRVTIMPRGRALGLTYQTPQDDRQMYDEPYVRARITGALGGRAAEEVVFGLRTTGAANDMLVATDFARQMVTRWGMSDQFGALALAPRDGGFLGYADSFMGGAKPFSEATAQRIDDEVQRILDECYASALELVIRHRAELDALAGALLERESLDENEILTATGITPARLLESTTGETTTALSN